MVAHQKIGRIGHPGYKPRRWCAVCGLSASKSHPYVCCDGETDCRNVCHIACLGDRDAYTCDVTQQLRQEANIDAAVVYEDEDVEETPDTPAPPPFPPVDDIDAPTFSEDVDNERQEYMAMDREELVSLTLRLKQEVMGNKNVIQSLTLQRDWIIEKKAQVLDILEFIETLSDARDADARRSTRTIGTSAAGSWIDKSWEKACRSSERWRQWWESENTKRLPPSRVGLTPPTLSTATNTSPTTAAATTVAATIAAATSTTPITSLTPNPANNGALPTATSSTSTTASPSTPPAQHNNQAAARNPTNNSGGRKRQAKKSHTGRGARMTPPAAQNAPLPRPRHPPPPRGRRGCEYCLRPGHSREECFSRIADARQEAILRRVLAEGRRNGYAPHPQPPAPFRGDSGWQHRQWEEQPRSQRGWTSAPWESEY